MASHFGHCITTTEGYVNRNKDKTPVQAQYNVSSSRANNASALDHSYPHLITDIGRNIKQVSLLGKYQLGSETEERPPPIPLSPKATGIPLAKLKKRRARRVGAGLRQKVGLSFDGTQSNAYDSNGATNSTSITQLKQQTPLKLPVLKFHNDLATHSKRQLVQSHTRNHVDDNGRSMFGSGCTPHEIAQLLLYMMKKHGPVASEKQGERQNYEKFFKGGQCLPELRHSQNQEEHKRDMDLYLRNRIQHNKASYLTLVTHKLTQVTLDSPLHSLPARQHRHKVAKKGLARSIVRAQETKEEGQDRQEGVEEVSTEKPRVRQVLDSELQKKLKPSIQRGLIKAMALDSSRLQRRLEAVGSKDHSLEQHTTSNRTLETIAHIQAAQPQGTSEYALVQSLVATKRKERSVEPKHRAQDLSKYQEMRKQMRQLDQALLLANQQFHQLHSRVALVTTKPLS